MSSEAFRPAWRSAVTLFVLYLLLGYASSLLAKGTSHSVPVWLGAAVMFAFFIRSHSTAWLFVASWPVLSGAPWLTISGRWPPWCLD